MITSTRLGALAERPFRLLWIGRTTSAFGDALMPVTLAFAVLSVGGTATDLGAVLATSTVVRVVLLLFGGTLADRMPRRLLLVGSDVFLFVVQSCVGVLLLTGRPSVTVLTVAAICYGAAAAIARPAFTGIVPQTVSTHRLQQANALTDVSRSTVEILGPLLAGVAVVTTSAGWVYLLDAATFLISAVALGMLKLPRRPPREHGSFLADLAVGWREMASRSWYWISLCCHALWNLGSCAFLVLGPVIIAREAGGASAWGLISASMAVGALAGGVLSLRWQPRRPLIVAHLGLALTALQLIALIDPAPILVSMAAGTLAAAGVAFVNNVWVTIVQRLIPEEVLSRVASYDWLVSFTVAPLGYAAAGPLAEQTGNTTVLVIAAGCVCVAVLAVLLPPRIRSLRQHRGGELHGWPELDEPLEPARTLASVR
ncbi:MFS transporter [Catellatospora citrea]|uniref:MFS transporter n=1 Tax=Catellatospora citrea TaxID=53366 RepID=A0A8J3KKH2_9ACTN|nr:MFS transporter [Catellatospora citrea]RKE05531.1 putative MFS family arabinose efflux permease [Catellatospora citrea]GIF96879.1 MFS transporter [Catellatospora citrea]